MTTGRINQVAMLANATFRACPRGRNILLRSTKQPRRFRLLPTRLPALSAGMRIGEIAYQLISRFKIKATHQSGTACTEAPPSALILSTKPSLNYPWRILSMAAFPLQTSFRTPQCRVQYRIRRTTKAART